VVDVNRTNRRILVGLLQRWGASVEEAADGQAALDRIEAAHAQGHPFDLAILDYQMPGLDGLDVADAIRARPPLAGLSLILLSSALSKEHRPRIDAARVFAAFQKPARQSTLQRTLQKLWSVESTGAETEVNAQGAGRAPTARSGWPSSGAAPRLLIAEDNIVNQKLAARLVERLGYAVDVVGDGTQALEAVAQTRYALVLMDCQMPNLDGYETTREIRRREAGAGTHLPIVALTANALCEERDACLAAGMDNYLSKPVKRDDLAAMIALYVARSHGGPFPHSKRIRPTGTPAP
jgi:CheY-like chemotaxis protein